MRNKRRSDANWAGSRTTILTGFGLGQGAYLAKRAAGNVGAS